jgi:protein-L-isoaspartate(D-aspartate) O-methyltransferase
VIWIDARISLFPDAGGPTPFVPWQALGAEIDRWRAEKAFDRCFFVRKPPGLRVRFGGAGVRDALEPSLAGWLCEAERANEIRGFRFGIYEPEEYRFGGPAGTAVAHEHLDGAARVALAFERRPGGLTRAELAANSVADLLQRSLDDSAEAWDVVQRLGRSLEMLVPEPGSGAPDAGLRAAARSDPTFLTVLSVDGRALVEDTHAVNAITALALRNLANAGRLHVGTRAWLVALATFQLNVLGLALDPAAPGAVACAWSAMFDPR